eukprot:366476-Chlamydomonas_euryale.AAC.10
MGRVSFGELSGRCLQVRGSGGSKGLWNPGKIAQAVVSRLRPPSRRRFTACLLAARSWGHAGNTRIVACLLGDR